MSWHLSHTKECHDTIQEYDGDDGRLPEPVRAFNRAANVQALLVAPLRLAPKTLGWIALSSVGDSDCERRWRHCLCCLCACVGRRARSVRTRIRWRTRIERRTRIKQRRKRGSGCRHEPQHLRPLRDPRLPQNVEQEGRAALAAADPDALRRTADRLLAPQSETMGHDRKQRRLAAEALVWMIERCCHQVAHDRRSEDRIAAALSEIIWRTVGPTTTSWWPSCRR